MQANYDLIDGNPHYVQPRLVEVAEVKFEIGDRVRTRTFQGQQHFRANYLNREAVIRDFAPNNYYLLSFGDEADICYWDANDLELVQDVLGVEIAPKGCWIESITAKRKRKSGRVVQYEYFHLVTWDAQTKRERRRHLGSASNPRYLEMREAIARRERLGKEVTNG